MFGPVGVWNILSACRSAMGGQLLRTKDPWKHPLLTVRVCSLLNCRFLFREERGGIQWIFPIECYRSVSITFCNCWRPGSVDELSSYCMSNHYRYLQKETGLHEHGKRRQLYFSIFSTFCCSSCSRDRGMRSPAVRYRARVANRNWISAPHLY